MLILTRCGCCDVGIYEDEQRICHSCSETVCPKCAGTNDPEAKVDCSDCVMERQLSAPTNWTRQ